MTDGRPLRQLAPPGRKKFARNLHAIRTSRRLSEGEVAAGCLFATNKVQALERATAEPETADLIKLASVLGVPVNDLVAGVQPQDFRERDRPTRRVLNEIEEGARDAGLGHLVVIADALGVRVSDLLKGAVWRGGVLYHEGKPVEE